MASRSKFLTNPSVAAIGVTIAVALLAAYWGFVAIDLRGLEGAEIGTLFLTLVFTALVIERAVEVFVNNRYNLEELRILRPIREAQQRLTLQEEALSTEIARAAPPGGDAAASAAADEKKQALERLRAEVDAARAAVRAAKVAALDDQIDLKVRKTAAAGAMATVLSLLAAAAGVRVLGQFLDAAAPIRTDAAHDFQLGFFRFSDIVLTTLLLAGGADGIHQLIGDLLSKRSDLKPK